jgi:hypothetical protein
VTLAENKKITEKIYEDIKRFFKDYPIVRHIQIKV